MTINLKKDQKQKVCIMMKFLILTPSIFQLEQQIKPVDSFKINKKSANQFLKNHVKRVKRNNDGHNEEEAPGRAIPNYERECVEENCDYNEINEIVSKKWLGREELLDELYHPTRTENREKEKKTKKTNIPPPIYTKENNPAEYYKQATKDLNNMLHKGCDYYHPMQKAFYNTNTFADNEDIRLCDDYGTQNCHINGKIKTCQCKRHRNSFLHIRKGRYCEACHENCFLNYGHCKRNEDKSEYDCDCPKLRIITTNGTELVDDTKYSWEHKYSWTHVDGTISRRRVRDFCARKVVDYCVEGRDLCYHDSTICESMENGYKCSCKYGYVADGEYKCKQMESQRLVSTV